VVAAVEAEAEGLSTDGRPARVRTWAARFFDQDGSANRKLTLGIAVLVGALTLASLPRLLDSFPFGLDFEVYLRAAAHWSSGAPVYPPSAMQVSGGADLPYLYPPFWLPLLAPIATLPLDPVLDAWFAVCLLVAVWTCRRLGIPWLAVPCLLVWPPFGEVLRVGNVQVLMFAAFVAVFYESRQGLPEQRELLARADLWNGVLASVLGALKVTQALPSAYLARRRFRAALVGAALVGVAVLVTLPLTGLSIYGDWLAQLQRASSPNWTAGGTGLGRSVGIPDVVMIAIGFAMALTVRGRDSAAWLGIALVIATPSAHGYTFLFLLPALLTIRRDLAILIGSLFLLYYTVPWWLATGLTAGMLLGTMRWPHLRLRSRSPGGALPPAGSAGRKRASAAAPIAPPARPPADRPLATIASPHQSPFRSLASTVTQRREVSCSIASAGSYSVVGGCSSPSG
jgi:hypothetical protein